MRVQRWARWRIAIVFALLVGAYFTAAFIGRSLSHSITDVPLVWFPPGVGLAAILLVGLRRWPIVLVATFLAHWILSRMGDSGLVLPGHSLWGVIAAADTIAAVSGAYFARKLGRTDPCLSAPDFLRFAAFSAGGTGVLAATVVTIGFVATGSARSDGLLSVWLEWWLAYAVGILTMTPLILAWHRDRTIYWKWPRALELLVSIGFLAVLSYLLLVRGKNPTPSWHVALPIATILIWCAVRFGHRETAAGLFVLALVAGAAAAGPASFGGESIDESAPMFQIGLGLLSVSSLGLAVRNDDRRRSRRKLDVYRLAALQTADHWMITDVNGMVVEVNPAFEKVTGYTQSELVGKKPNVIRSGIHDKAFYENMWKTILSGEPYKGMVVNRRKNGELFYEIKSITPIRDENGRIAYFFSIGKDVTNLKQVEDELEKSATELEHMHERLALSEADLLRHIKILESVLSSSNEGVIVADRDGGFVMFSRAAKEMIGVGAISGPPSEWSASYGVFMKDGKTPFPTEELPLVRAIKGEIVNNVELFIRNPVKSDGVWLSISGRPLRDAAGNLMGGVIVARDITQDRWVKKASAELRATREELQIAERIQKRFFPRTPPTLEGGDIGGASRPAVVTGGDYYDYIQTPDGSLLLVMGDVSGHGFGPALLMASVRAYVHALAASGVEAKDIVRVVNRLLARDTNVGDFVTLLMVRVDLAARRCEYVSAGHETAYVLDSAGRVKHALKSMLPPLGVLPEIGLREMSTFEIDPGDLLLMVTDGIMEAENTDGEPFGEERLVEAVRCNHHHRASEIVAILHKAVANYCGGKVQDDITSIVLKYDPKT